MSQRLALDIATPKAIPQHLLATTSPLQLMHTIHEQVADYMHVCMSVEDGMESLYAIAPSEPILSEAASWIMQDANIFFLPDALKIILSDFGIEQGECAQLLVTSFFTWARDQVVFRNPSIHPGWHCQHFSVNKLFSHLFSDSVFDSISGDIPSLYHSEATRRPFRSVFDEAIMHFNHFIKPQVRQIMARQYLSLNIARGAAALGTNCQPDIDAVFPYLYGGIDLDPKKIGFIIVQAKNDSESHCNVDELFLKMDPFQCGLLNKSKDLEDGIFPIPIIRLLFLLRTGNDEPSVKMYKPPSQGTTTVETVKDTPSIFTSYDYVCSGVSEHTLRPVGESPDVWASLVNKPDPWTSFYSVPQPDLLRSLLPGCETDEGQWKNWVEGPAEDF